MLIRKPEEFKTQLSFAEKYGCFSNDILVKFLIEVMACSKCNPEHDYSSLIQGLRAKNPALLSHEIYAHVLYLQQKEFKDPLYSQNTVDLLFRELNFDASKDVEFINQVFYFALTSYISISGINHSWQTVCINLLTNPDVNPSYRIRDNQSASDVVLRFEYIKDEYQQGRLKEHDYSTLTRVEWDTYEKKLPELTKDDIFLYYGKINSIHFQKIPALFAPMAENYFRQYQTAQKAELKQETLTPITTCLDRLFCLAIDSARFENDFALLNKFIEYQEQGFTPSYTDVLQKIIKSFKNWITNARDEHYGRIPQKGYVDRPLFQLLNNHFKPLIPDFIKEMAQYSLRSAREEGHPWNSWFYYHANDMLLVFRKYLSLNNHSLYYSWGKNLELKVLMNQHALLILNTIENYIVDHKQDFMIQQEWPFFREGTKITCNDEAVYLPEFIAELIKISRTATKENAHDLLHNYLNDTLSQKAVPKEKDAEKPAKRSQYVHDFYIALRDENLNHPIIKQLEKTVTRKILEPYRQQIASAIDDAAPVLSKQMTLPLVQLIYEYADVSELKDKPAVLKPLGYS